MKTSRLALAAGFLASTTAQPALANSPESVGENQPARSAADTTFSVGEIVVSARGKAGNTASILTSVDRLGGNLAKNADVNNVFELIGQMPGIQLTDFNQGTTSGKFSLRGFNDEGTINAVKLLIDGLPANSNDGNMPYIDMVFPLNIAGIEVVRGTSDPRYGLHAIAGSANILTRTAVRSSMRALQSAAMAPSKGNWWQGWSAALSRRTTRSPIATATDTATTATSTA